MIGMAERRGRVDSDSAGAVSSGAQAEVAVAINRGGLAEEAGCGASLARLEDGAAVAKAEGGRRVAAAGAGRRLREPGRGRWN